MKTAKKIIAVIMILSMTLALGQGMESKKAQAESYQSATTINLNGGWTGDKYVTSMESEQWYKMIVPSDGRVNFKFMHYMEGMVVYLYNEDLSNELKRHDLYGGTSSSPQTDMMDWDLSKGTYYIKILNYYKGRYKLNTTFKSYDVTDSNAHSYDNSQNMSLGKDMIGAITLTDTVDWFKVIISKAGYYNLKITQYMYDFRVSVYNEDLSEEIKSREYYNGNELSPKVNSEDIVLKSGTYYVRVISDTGKYILNLSALTQSNCSHEFENNTVSATYLRKGYTLHKCKKCGKTTKDEYTAKLTLAQGYIWSYGMKPGKKKIRVSYSYINNVSGYQIRYSTNKKFKKGVKVVKAGKNTLSKTLKKLKKKKRYYVQVRGYKKVSGKVVYGKWSSKRSAKTR